MNGARELRVALILLSVITFTAVARAQQAQPGAPGPLSSSTVPRSVPFNGQVRTPKGDARSGSVMLTFGLYPDQTGGTPIWTEQQLVALDSDGRYSVILGSTSAEGLPADAFAAGTPRWLGVQVEGETEQPRFMLLSVPYALKAGDADTVGGKPVTELVTSSHLVDSVKSAIKASNADPSAPFVTPNALVKYQNSGGTLTESSTVDVGGKLGVQVAAPIGELDVAGFGSSTTVTLRNGGSAADVVKLVGADGSLRIGSATNANLINLIGSNVGIGTTTPADKLTVQTSGYGFTQTDGTVTVGSWLGGAAGWYGTKSNHPLYFFTNDSSALMTVSTSGNVGIGTATPTAKLDVRANSALIRLSGVDCGPNYGAITFGSVALGCNNYSLLGEGVNTFINRPAGGALLFRENNVDQMIIQSGGNVGIGTSNHPERLSVRAATSNGTVAFTVRDSSDYPWFSVDDVGRVKIGSLFIPSLNASHVCASVVGKYLSSCSSAAEYVATVERELVYPGGEDLVSIAGVNPYGDDHAPFAVTKSAMPCDANLLGFLLDPASGADGQKVNDHYLPLAIYGYFPAKVTIENGAVKRGDPITSSSKPGVGMKSTGACRIIGYALEDADQDGTIQVFAHLSESAASAAAPLQTEMAALRRDNADLQMRVDRLEQALSAILANRHAEVERR